jgi:hypothetical protein
MKDILEIVGHDILSVITHSFTFAFTAVYETAVTIMFTMICQTSNNRRICNRGFTQKFFRGMATIKFITVFQSFIGQNARYRGYNQVHCGLRNRD